MEAHFAYVQTRRPLFLRASEALFRVHLETNGDTLGKNNLDSPHCLFSPQIEYSLSRIDILAFYKLFSCFSYIVSSPFCQN